MTRYTDRTPAPTLDPAEDGWSIHVPLDGVYAASAMKDGKTISWTASPALVAELRAAIEAALAADARFRPTP